MLVLLNRLINDEAGQDFAEYGILLALIAVVLVTAVTALQGGILAAFNSAAAVLP